MKRTKNSKRVVFLRSQLPEEDLPTEFRVFAFGTNESTKGPAIFDEEAARLVMEAYEQHGAELMLDYEHQVLADPPVEAPAAGWASLEVRGDGSDPEKDGLFAVDIRWTEKAEKYLRAKEYRYTSPAFFQDENGRVTGLLNVALTNTPATHGLTPLVAASQAADFRVATRAQLSLNDLVGLIRMAIDRLVNGRAYDSWVYVCDVFDDHAVYEQEGHFYRVDYVLEGTTVTITSEPVEQVRSYSPVVETPGENTEMKRILKALGLAEDATEDEALAKLEELQELLEEQKGDEDEEDKETVEALSQVLALTGRKTPSEALGTVKAWKTSAEQVTALSSRVTALETEKRQAEVKTLVAQGLKAGQLTPAMEAWAVSLGEKDVVQLRTYLETAPKIVTLGQRNQEPKPQTATTKKWSELTPMEKHNLKRSDPATYEALKAEAGIR